MKCHGPLHFFLGAEVKYFIGGIHLNKSKYVAKLLYKIYISLVKVINTPLAQKHGLHEGSRSLLDAFYIKR